MSRSEKFWFWLARLLPRELVVWCVVRVFATGRNGSGGWEVPPEIYSGLVRFDNNREHNFYGHSQNLSDGKRPMWEHGRAWLRTWRLRWRAEWSLLKRARLCMLQVDIGGEDDIQLAIGIPFIFTLFLTLGGLFKYNQLPRDWHRTTGVRIFEGYIWFEIWNDNSWGGRGKPRWQEFHVNIPDLLLGRSNYSDKTISTHNSAVVLPEGSYPVTVRLFESTWKRSRWPKATRLLRAEIESEKGIPSHAGKGENDWDLDDDVLFGMTCAASTVEEAVKKCADSILKDRAKYGMPELP